MGEIVTIILGILDAPAKIKQYVFDPIKTQFSYIRQYSDIMGRLTEKNQELNSTRDHLQLQIQYARYNGHNIVPHVEIWCTRVDQRKEVVDRILSDEPRDQNDTCLQGTCSSLKLRYSRSREAKKLTAEIVELLKDYNDFRSHISDPAPPRMGGETTLVTCKILEFDSRKQIEEDIMSYLRDDSIGMIGVCGMGGVGKTIMAEKIRERASKEKLFNRILMAVVSQQVNLLEIQGRLAQGLGFRLIEEAVPMRATELSTRLMEEKVLIILDDVWNPLNLVELGIPSETKLLLTTRYVGVCRRMPTVKDTKILALKVLNEEEAITLFFKTVGNVADNLRPLAENVAKECKGLPLALVVVGCSLKRDNDKRDVDESIWRASLGELQRSAPDGIDGYLEGVYRPLKLSYDRLESNELKYLFLLCSLFPEDWKIEIIKLVHYGVGLNIFSAISISEARDKVNLIVKRLIDRCLLINAGDTSCTHVKMHDVIRDMALSIASGGEHKFMVSHDKGLTEWPHESYTCISLTLGEAMTFQEGMHCQGLKALLLTFDLSSTMLPQNFLNGMADLTLLSIHGQHRYGERVFRLPLSFLSSLTKLRVLHLHQCGLEDTDVSLLGQVKDLEILSCSGSDIQKLPNEIRALRKLKLLDMTNCWKLKNIAPDVFPALVKLEELRLMGCPIEWERQETGDGRRNASLAEVFSLKILRFLEIWINDLEVISKEINYSLKLTSYSIVIGGKGDAFVMEGSYTNLKRMSVHVDERMVFSDAISKLIEDAKEVKLKGNGCKGIIELLGRGGFENVRSLEIDGLGDVKILIEPTRGRVIFPIIRHLELSNMNDLEEICNGHPSGRSFSELEKITIKSCAKLKCVFPLSIAESLSKLERLEVWYCPVVEEVFNKSESGTTTVNHVKFPNLKKMELQKLPRLGAWCKTVDAVIEFPSIETLRMNEVSPNFKGFGNLQLTQVTCTKLRELTISHLGVEIFYPEIQPNGFFPALERLDIKSFHGLRTLFSRTVFRALSNLCILIVEDCTMLEEIIETKKDENEGDRNNINKLSRLRYLQLFKLPKIRYFGHFNNVLELPSLVNVKIEDCPVMETFVVVSRAFELPSLERVKIVNCPKMEAFVEDELWCTSSMSSGSITARNLFNKQVSCTKLRELTLELPSLRVVLIKDCAVMKTFVVVNCTLELPLLERVEIINCPKMEAFVEDELWCRGSIRTRNFFHKQVTCPKLRYLLLDGINISGLLFSFETPISSLGALSWLEIRTCHNLKSLLTSQMFEGLVSLSQVIVHNCSLFEEVIAKDENEDVDEMVVSIPKLESLYLTELPKLQGFSHTRCDLELPRLTNIRLIGCTEIISFCLGGGSVRMASGVKVEGISYPKFAFQLFFPTQHAPEEDSLDNGSFKLFQSDISFTWDYEEPSVVKGTSNAFFLHGWKKACGKFDMEKLSSEITYEIAFVIMLLKLREKDDEQLETMLADDKRQHTVKGMPRQEWMEILVGELRPLFGQSGDITFSLQKKYASTRVALKCASIRPKRIASNAM